jgi:hypothetical protein
MLRQACKARIEAVGCLGLPGVETMMPTIRFAIRLALAAFATLLAIGPSLAGPGRMGMPYWGQEAPRSRYDARDRRVDPREGKIETAHFVAENGGAGSLGRGTIIVASAPGSMGDSRENATYEAAVVDQLVKAGYDTAAGAVEHGQVVELVITHDVVRPEAPPHKPVSGEAMIGVSNRGSMMGLAVDVDLTKPLKALVATRLEARIRDRATNALLWEGRSVIITREGDSHWTTPIIANRLAAALFKDFPGKS